MNQLEQGVRGGALDLWLKVAQVLGGSFARLVTGAAELGGVPAIPLDGTIAPDGAVASISLATAVLPAGAWKHEPVTETLVVASAGPGWCAVRAEGRLASDRTDYPVTIEAGDVVVMRLTGGKPPESGQVIVVAQDVDGFEAELRLYVLEGKRHQLWPLSADQRIEELVEPWRAVAVAVEQRRRL